MQGDASVPPLQQVPQLPVPQVRLKAQVVVRGVGHRVPARAMTEAVPSVAAGTARAVLYGARNTARSATHHTRDEALAGAMLIWTDAAVRVLRVLSNKIVLTAVQD